MTLFPFCLLSKKTKQRWLEDRIAKLESEFKGQLEHVEAAFTTALKQREFEIKQKENELRDLTQRLDDRKTELESKKNELREQIRLIEAKASPDSIWTSAFSAGFTKAWDMMQPLMTEGVHKMKQTIRDQAISETLSGLETHIERRIDAAGKTQIKDANKAIAKKEDLVNRIANSVDEVERTQLSHYLEAINWIFES